MASLKASSTNQRRVYLLCIIVLCFILYFSYKFLNVEYHLHTPESRTMPSIVVFSNQHDVNTKCFFNISSQPLNKTWQKLEELHLYSAHTDKRGEMDVLRIIAMSKGKWTRNAFCRIWYETMESMVTEIEVLELWVHSWDLAKPDEYFRPLLLTCIPSRDRRRPLAISVVLEPCDEPQNILSLTPYNSDAVRKQFAVCLKPLDFEEDISPRLIEWLELLFLLGTDQVRVYIYHVHPKMLEVLKNYEKWGKLVLKMHTLPANGPNEPTKRKIYLNNNIWQKRRHEMLIYNDCFYSFINSHQFTVNLDLDEAIIPIEHDTWKDLLRHISLEKPQTLRTASLSAANIYFFDSFGEYPDPTIPRYMHMLRHVYRSANFTPPGFAQKSFFLTNNTLSVSNHYALNVLRPNLRTTLQIDRRSAKLHHYRNECPPLMEENCKENFMKFREKDTVIWKFKDKLIAHVCHVMRTFNLMDPIKMSKLYNCLDHIKKKKKTIIRIW